ncbi:hypothetical protein CDV31_010423 [Fusarium ambrosium]|uniref:Uncharacterized protein n=1 Tax=Fusarium ambrosium TaxID=131363 RepID=A0A428TNK9_9HYPO|nr:hypothetical protein CDV31_010423 [Fusarium ambrosium]
MFAQNRKEEHQAGNMVTSTRTIHPTSIMIITLQPTACNSPNHHRRRNDMDVETITEADTTHATNFVTVTETETETEVATEIKLITETKIRTDPWSPPECDERRVIADNRELRQRRTQLPSECSCLLPTTKGQEPVQTATVTITMPAVTLTIFKVTLKSPAVTRTVTLTHYAPGTTVSAPETTETITEHSTQTDHSLVSHR